MGKNHARERESMVSSKIASNMKKHLPNPNGIEEILAKATSLQELGLTIESVSEYEKLLATECHPGKIVPGLVACLAKTNSPSKIIRRVEEMVNRYDLSHERLAQLKFLLGVEMEKMGHPDLALDVYKSAARDDPGNRQIKDKIARAVSKLTPASRYDYLLHKGLVTPEQLQKALSASKLVINTKQKLLLINRRMRLTVSNVSRKQV